MNQNLTGVPCHLKLVPSELLVRFAPLHEDAAVAYYDRDVMDIDVTPGSLKLGDTEQDGLYQKRHTFEVKNLGVDVQRKFVELSKRTLVAFYQDAKGRQKVSGSPLYPLRMTVQPNGGTYACTLTGKTPWMDLFVIVGS